MNGNVYKGAGWTLRNQISIAHSNSAAKHIQNVRQRNLIRTYTCPILGI